MNPQDSKKIAVTKLEAARRQLETAITLWFHDSDPVSIYTLVAAAYQIIYDLNKHRKSSPMMKDSPCIRPECRGEVYRVMAKFENFFKHTDRDPLETILFPPEITRYFILDALDKYQEMAHERRPLFDLFTFYQAFTEPRVFKAEFIDQIRNLVPSTLLDGVSKRQYFQHVLPLVTRIGAT